MPFALPRGEWKTRWTAPLDPSMQPEQVLPIGGRHLVPGLREWRLFDHNGKLLQGGGLGAGAVTIDAKAGLFYAAHPAGLLMARKLGDGSLAYQLFAYGGYAFRRSLLAVRAGTLNVLSEEFLSYPHSAYQPNLTVLESINLGHPAVSNEQGILTSAQMKGRLVRHSPSTPAVLHQGRFIAAIEDGIYFFDDDLRILRAIGGKFVPFTISCDESGHLRLVVKVDDQTKFWLLNPDGELLGEAVLRDNPTRYVCPPVAGYDHRTFLVTNGAVLALAADGQELWRSATPGRAMGATVSADGHVLVSAGSQVIAYGENDRGRVLYSSNKGSLATAAVLTVNEELMVATNEQLICLST
ncbi:MAG TPA: PQQ-binding-like beta-propeller repeat protein [Bryobacteraceae bacterium]|nr:PQQ-binding-like beta-propeller repeat protein [Bryobacteraceae bacterium]